MADTPNPERFTLSRWSRRKLDAAREKAQPAVAEPPDATLAVPVPGAAPDPAPAAANGALAAAPELPPVESLTIESDFTAFLEPQVDESTRRAALRKLFSDPSFNVMDGLDVYIDDYNKATPIPDDVLRKLAHVRDVLDPPKTRVNAMGYVEDVPDDETEGAVAVAPAASSPDGAPAESQAPAALPIADVAPSQGPSPAGEPQPAPGVQSTR